MAESPVDPVRELVAANLRALKRLRGVTDRAIGAAVGMTGGQVNERINGVTSCSASDLARFALYFGVPVSYFFEAHELVLIGAGEVVPDQPKPHSGWRRVSAGGRAVAA